MNNNCGDDDVDGEESQSFCNPQCIKEFVLKGNSTLYFQPVWAWVTMKACPETWLWTTIVVMMMWMAKSFNQFAAHNVSKSVFLEENLSASLKMCWNSINDHCGIGVND